MIPHFSEPFANMKDHGLAGPFYIYGLVDPDTVEVRYIGKSVKPHDRLRSHINEPPSNCHRSHWIQALKRQGKEPGLVIFEEVWGEWPWQESERYWIARGKSLGWRLTNNTSGGDGVPDLSPAARARIAAAWRGRKHRPETLEKLREARKSFRHTEETKRAMSARHAGRSIHWADKIAAAVRKLSDDDVSAIRSRLADGETVVSLARKFGVHRTTISKVKKGAYP